MAVTNDTLKLTTAQRLDLLTERIQDPDFLANKGLGNEVGLHVFTYDPKDELLVREHIKRLQRKQDLACNIVERNLWDVLLKIFEEDDLLEALDEYEREEGSDGLLERLETLIDL